MKKLLIIALLFVGCATEPEEDNIIDLPTEFPLVANSGWVYEVSKYTNVEDFLSGNNSTIRKDTLVILDTSQDYYLWHFGGSNIDSNSIGFIFKNYDNKLLMLGVQEILSEDVIQFFDKPGVWANFSDTFTIDTLNYDYGFIERTTTIDTLKKTKIDFTSKKFSLNSTTRLDDAFFLGFSKNWSFSKRLMEGVRLI